MRGLETFRLNIWDETNDEFERLMVMTKDAAKDRNKRLDKKFI
jgi:hypothetical protein